MFFIFISDAVINKHNAIYTNENINVTKINKLDNFNCNNYLTEKIKHTSNIANNIARHHHNNYEHNVIQKVNQHIKHISNYDTEINYYNKKSLNKKNYYNLYHDTFNFRKNEIICNSQQTGITNNILDTNTQTTNHIDENDLNNNKIAAVIANPAPPLMKIFLWIPETSDNGVVSLG